MAPTMKKHATTNSCRPIIKPGKLRPLPPKSISEVFLPNQLVPRSSIGSFATVKNATCMPSRHPTINMKKINMTTASGGLILGYLTFNMVSPLKSATPTTVVQNPRMPKDIRTRPQKNALVNPDMTFSLDRMALPLAAVMAY